MKQRACIVLCIIVLVGCVVSPGVIGVSPRLTSLPILPESHPSSEDFSKTNAISQPRSSTEDGFGTFQGIWDFRPAPQGLYIFNKDVSFFPFCLVIGDLELRVYCDWQIEGVVIKMDTDTLASLPYAPGHWYNYSWVNDHPRLRFFLHYYEIEIHELDGAILGTGFPLLRIL